MSRLSAKGRGANARYPATNSSDRLRFALCGQFRKTPWKKEHFEKLKCCCIRQRFQTWFSILPLPAVCTMTVCSRFAKSAPVSQRTHAINTVHSIAIAAETIMLSFVFRFIPNICTVLLLTALWGIAPVVYAHGTEHDSEPKTVPDEAGSAEPSEFADVVRNAPVPQINVSVGGKWSDVYDWPLVAIHAALLPNGKVLAWDATPDDSDDDPHTTDNYTTRVTLWDPITDTHVQTNNDTDTDLFCAGSAHLWDGRILFAGGDGGKAGANGPLANSNIYNPVSNTWHRTENMQAPRWYSSVAALSNGEMLTLGGTYEPTPLAEVFQFDQTWRGLSGDFPQPLNGDYQWLQQTPEGSVLYFGPANVLVDIDTTGAGSYTSRASRDTTEFRDYGSYAMYEPGKILVAGGAQGLNTAVVIDTATRQTIDTNPMITGRRQHNLTILADGSVLASGGNNDGAQYYSPTAGVYQPEIWNPETQAWTAQNTIPTDRQYHSIALLLPDGQVLSAGGGICGDCYAMGYEERNAEIFSPPYLFNQDGSFATRPQLGAVAETMDYAEQLPVSISDSINIEKAHLIKLGSVTHSENQDQRLVPLDFERAANQLTIRMPESRHVAPPGHYLLFVVDNNGVPSKGSIIKLGQPLIGVGELLRSTLEVNTWDSYLTQPMGGRATIELSAANGTQLYVSATSQIRSAQQANVLCNEIVQSTDNASCELDVSAGTQLHVSVSGSVRSDYSLVYTVSTPVSPVTPVTPESPETSIPPEPDTISAKGTGQVRTGVGATSQYLLLILMVLAVLRPFSYRNRLD